jgi:hypothetical protein
MDFGVLTNTTAIAVSIIALVVSTIFTQRQLRSARASTSTAVTVEMLSREMRGDALRESVDYVIHRLPTEYGPEAGVDGLPIDARGHVYNVALFYGNLGHLVVFGAIDERVVLSMANYSLRRAWFTLEPYIRAEREIRQSHFMGFFEHIACRAAELKPAQLHRELGLRTFDPAVPADARTFSGEGVYQPRRIVAARQEKV